MKTRRSNGQGMVEFALVAPIFFAMLFGVIASGWLFFQNEAVTSAAQSGARQALVEAYDANTGQMCEDPTASSTISVQAAATHAATILPVDQAPLCGSATATVTCPNDSPTPTKQCEELTQTADSGTMVITLYAAPSFTTPDFFEVKTSYVAHPFAPFSQKPMTLTATSILNSQGK
jgi:Flp pilus assembly protein TadG